MIRISQIKLPVKHTKNDLLNNIQKSLKLKDNNFKYKIIKKSIDARKGEIKYIYTVDVEINNEKNIVNKVYNKNITLTKAEKYDFSEKGNLPLQHRPIIVGCGPAGLFCAYMLSKNGYKPIVLERGEDVDNRINTVETFFTTGILNTESNVQFGEGGAGTFSDGKLNTMIKDKFHRNDFILETFVEHGANENITYINKPHIGTDVLSKVVKNMRIDAQKNGAEFRFNTKFIKCNYTNNILNSIDIEESNHITTTIPCNVLVLAIGHSSRDTFKMLYDSKILMEPKAFAMGVRIEHLQEQINQAQYGKYKDIMPAADYKLATNLENGRGVYSFCMCPGGYVVNSSSEEKSTSVNGMSYSKRDGKNANSAMIVTVTPKDFPDATPLGGMELQRKLEKTAYIEGNGKIPIQTYSDFKGNVTSKTLGEINPQTKGEYEFANLRNILPEYMSASIIEGVEFFSHKIKGYNRADAILSGVESRTSSPLRIIRNEDFESNVSGIYPCGEGAGYAGGITSAATDGIKVYEAIAKKYAPLTD